MGRHIYSKRLGTVEPVVGINNQQGALWDEVLLC